MFLYRLIVPWGSALNDKLSKKTLFNNNFNLITYRQKQLSKGASIFEPLKA